MSRQPSYKRRNIDTENSIYFTLKRRKLPIITACRYLLLQSDASAQCMLGSQFIPGPGGSFRRATLPPAGPHFHLHLFLRCFLFCRVFRRVLMTTHFRYNKYLIISTIFTGLDCFKSILTSERLCGVSVHLMHQCCLILW